MIISEIYNTAMKQKYLYSAVCIPRKNAGTEKFWAARVPLSASCSMQAEIFQGFACLLCQRSNLITEFSFGELWCCIFYLGLKEEHNKI